MWFLWTPSEAKLNFAVGPSHTMAMTLYHGLVCPSFWRAVGCGVGIAVRIAARLVDHHHHHQ